MTNANKTLHSIKEAKVVSLDDLAKTHGTDKGTQHFEGGKLTPKGYAPIYEHYFKRFKTQQFNLIEIGVWQGGSLRMWADYFPRARIVGVDINPVAKRYETNQIKIAIADQSDGDMLMEQVRPLLLNVPNVGRKAKIIIDDGSHRMQDQLISLSFLWKILEDYGYYAIEDLRAPYREWLGARMSETKLEYSIFEELKDLMFQAIQKSGDTEAVHIQGQLAIIKKRTDVDTSVRST